MASFFLFEYLIAIFPTEANEEKNNDDPETNKNIVGDALGAIIGSGVITAAVIELGFTMN